MVVRSGRYWWWDEEDGGSGGVEKGCKRRYI